MSWTVTLVVGVFFYRATLCISAAPAVVVYLSVTVAYCIETSKVIIKRFFLGPVIPSTLVIPILHNEVAKF